MEVYEPFSVDFIFDKLNKSLHKSGKAAHEAVETLLTIELGLLQLRTHRPWGELLTQAIVVANSRKSRNSKRVLDLMNLRGKFYIHNHQDSEAYTAFQDMLNLATEHGMLYYQIEAYIGLLQVHVRLPREIFDEELLHELVSATNITSLEQKRRFGQALANFGIHQGNHTLCIDFGNIVYDEWRRENNFTEMARIAHAVSQAYRLDGNTKAAHEWHEKAQAAFTLSGDLKHRAILAYNWAFQQLYEQDYREAEYWMRTAVEEYDKLGDIHGKMVAAHGLAMAIAYHESDLHEGLRFLDEAVNYWNDQDNKTYIAHAYHTYGFLHHKLGNSDVALDYLKTGIEMYKYLPENGFNNAVSGKMWELLEIIESGGSIDTLKPEIK